MVGDNISENRLLSILPDTQRSDVISRLERKHFNAGELMLEEQTAIDRLYFTVEGIISVVSLMENGDVAESYTAGREGMSGAELIFDVDRLVQRVICQVPGDFYILRPDDFLELYRKYPEFARTVRRYLHCVFSMTAQSAACNAVHPLTERCARWLLTTHDRVKRDDFGLTQEMLATMLGVHRPAVTIAAGTLQKAGLIRYTRGRITVTDRAGLEEASCECYRIIADEYERVLHAP